MSPIIIGSLFRPLPVQPSKVFSRWSLNSRLLCQLCKKFLIAVACISPHNTSKRRIGFQCSGINPDGFSLNETCIRDSLKYPGEYQLMCFQIKQPTRTRNGRMRWRRIRMRQTDKPAQRKGIRRAPCNASFGIQSLKISDQEQAEIYTGNQSRPYHPWGVKFSANFFNEIIELIFLQNFIKAVIKRMCWRSRNFLRRYPKSLLSFAFSFPDCHDCYFTGVSLSEQYDISYIRDFNHGLLEFCNSSFI